MSELRMPVELTDSELDAVAAGQQTNHGVGLVVAGVNVGPITVVDVASHNAILNNSLDGNTVTVPIGVAVAALGGAAGVINHI